MSLLVARVKFEYESSSSHESSSSQVKKQLFFLNFVLISFDYDSCFHNGVPVVNSTDY